MNRSLNGDIDLSLFGGLMNRGLPNSICVPPNVMVQAKRANGAKGGHNSRVCASTGLYKSIEISAPNRILPRGIANQLRAVRRSHLMFDRI